MLVVGAFLDFRINPIVRPQFLIITIEPRTVDALPLLSYLGLWLVCVNLSKVIVLFQAVWQVLRIKVVTLLIWLVDRAVALVLWVR